MPFGGWCEENEEDVGGHKLTVFTGITGRLASGRDAIAARISTHYASEERIASLLERLGKGASAAFIRNKLPQGKKIRSGDLGEIFATEYVTESTVYTVPIKRLRWKDHRNMALRGDDLLAVRMPTDEEAIEFMKGETKSRASLTTQVLTEAREALDKDDGRPSPHALAFVADRLHELGDNEAGDAIDTAQLEDGIQIDQVCHLLFVFCGSSPSRLMRENLTAYGGTIPQVYVGLRVATHQTFIKSVYAKVIENGNND